MKCERILNFFLCELVLQIPHLLIVNALHQEHRERDGRELRDWECPPYGVKSKQLRKKIGGRQQNGELSSHGDDQAVDTVSERLENGSEDDAESGKQVTPADRAQRFRSDVDHVVGGVEEPQQCAWNELEGRESDHHQNKGKNTA